MIPKESHLLISTFTNDPIKKAFNYQKTVKPTVADKSFLTQAQSRFNMKELSILSPHPLLVLVCLIAQVHDHSPIFEKTLLFLDMDNLKPLWKMRSSSSAMQRTIKPTRKQSNPPTNQPGQNTRFTYLLQLLSFKVNSSRFNTCDLKIPKQTMQICHTQLLFFSFHMVQGRKYAPI